MGDNSNSPIFVGKRATLYNVATLYTTPLIVVWLNRGGRGMDNSSVQKPTLSGYLISSRLI